VVTSALAPDPGAVHTELTRNARGGLMPAQDYRAGGTRWPDDEEDGSAMDALIRLGEVSKRGAAGGAPTPAMTRALMRCQA
jgi:hypothetical protein